jgi:hypothetical protein
VAVVHFWHSTFGTALLVQLENAPEVNCVNDYPEFRLQWKAVIRKKVDRLQFDRILPDVLSQCL